MSSRAAARLAVPAWIALVLAVATGSLFHVLGNDFVWDDGPFIVWNESLRGQGVLQRILGAGDAFGTGAGNPYYRPVTTLSFAIDLWLFGDNPVGYHVTNLLLHLAVCALVFLAALKHTGRSVAAGAAALLFAVHPANVEPVAYISARADLLCAAFMLGSWLLYLRGRNAGSSRDTGLAVLAFSLALFSKLVALALLPVFVLYEIAIARRRQRCFRSLLPFAAAAAVFAIARTFVLDRTTWDGGESFTSRLATAGPMLLEYLRNTLLPFELKVFYDVPLRTSWADPLVVGAWAALAVCAGAWLVLLRRRPAAALGIAWFFAALFPVSGVVDLLYPALMADRYLYVPLVGAALSAAAAIPDPGPWRLPSTRGRRLAMAAAGCAVLAACVSTFAVTTAHRVPIWRDSVALWEEARRGAPASPYVLFALGSAYCHAQRLEEAELLLKQAAAIAPDYTDPKVNLAAVAFARGDLQALGRYTEEVLRIDPEHAVALRFRGLLFEGLGRLDLAIDAVRAAVEADPNDRLNHQYLLELVRAQGNEL